MPRPDREATIQSAKSALTPVLQPPAFTGPAQTEDSGMTRLAWLTPHLAVELELDWREAEAFLLVVRLEEGSMPSGYYLSGGRRSRIHLHEALDRLALEPAATAGSTRDRDRRLLESVTAHAANLEAHLDAILAAGLRLFDGT